MKDQLTKILQEFNELNRTKEVPLKFVIESIYGQKVLSFDKTKAENKKLLENLESVAKKTNLKVDEIGGIKSKRVNEVGNEIEKYVKEALEEIGYKTLSKTTKSGKNKSTGYPDFQFKDDLDRVCYLECKTFNLESVATTHRSFYLSPSSDPKVNSEGFHFVLSFEMKIDDKPSELGSYKCASYKIVSSENLSCTVRLEFNSDNKRLYAEELVLAQGNFLQSKSS